MAEGAAAVLPSESHLGLNYPNPFNPHTTIPLQVPASAGPVRLQVFNLLGQPLKTLVAGPLAAGAHQVGWDGRDEQGRPVSTGVYVYRLETGAWKATGKMVKVE